MQIIENLANSVYLHAGLLCRRTAEMLSGNILG